MTRYLLIALLGTVTGLGGYAWHLSNRLAASYKHTAALERSLVALREQAEQSALAKQVEAARAKAAAARSEQLSREIETILNGGIPDAPIHPSLAAIINSGRVHGPN